LALFEAGSSAYDKFMDDQIGKGGDHIWLTFLGVDPRYQRRGAGKQLLQWGVKRSNEEGIPIGLVASPVGCKLYRSVGFQNTGVLEIEGLPIKDVTMVRWPNETRRDASVQKTIEEQSSVA
jgi:ribosomal protein S18 acetylase RimI-like enzyme